MNSDFILPPYTLRWGNNLAPLCPFRWGNYLTLDTLRRHYEPTAICQLVGAGELLRSV